MKLTSEGGADITIKHPDRHEQAHIFRDELSVCGRSSSPADMQETIQKEYLPRLSAR
jgi:hypothetical protein